MRFIKLTVGTDYEDDEVFVNVENIDLFFSGATATFVNTLDDCLTVKETPEEIVNLIKNAEEI